MHPGHIDTGIGCMDGIPTLETLSLLQERIVAGGLATKTQAKSMEWEDMQEIVARAVRFSTWKIFVVGVGRGLSRL